MRVLVVGLATFDEMTGGSARYLSGMVDSLRDRGHEIEVITAGQTVAMGSAARSGALGQAGRLLKRAWNVHRRAIVRILRDRPDLLNVHFAYDGLGAVAAARLRRVPIVVMFQGPWAAEALATGFRGSWPFSVRVRRFIERRVYRSATRCTVLSAAFRDVLVREYGVAPHRIRVIPPGLDLAPYAVDLTPPEARSALGVVERRTVVTVRRLVKRMGIDLLVDALAELPESTRPQLLVAGSGPEREALEQQVRDRGLDGFVHFLGRVDDDLLPTFYAAGDLCVVPTRSLEGFGYVVVEAYAAGRPVLATAVGGLVEVVGAFDPDRLVAPNAAALAGAIQAAMAGPERLPDDSACRAYAAEFGWDRIAPRVEAVFDEARTAS